MLDEERDNRGPGSGSRRKGMQMATERSRDASSWLAQWADTPYAYLTTIGRTSGRAHRIEIWFAVHEGGRIYLMSGGRDRADWVRNLLADRHVTLEIGGVLHSGLARIVQAETDEDALARELLVGKYATPESPLTDWKQRSLVIVIEFEPEGRDT
jgi:deazaflavin-dependent oxidoreductase (nitroreductase family)